VCVTGLLRVIVIGFSILQMLAPDGPREETKYELQGGGSVGGGAGNAVRQCCHVITVASTRRLRPVSVHVAGVFFSHSQPRRTQFCYARQCDRLMSNPELSRYQSIVNCKLYYIDVSCFVLSLLMSLTWSKGNKIK